jgi:hypothetical protein
MRATLVAHSGESAAASAMRVLTTYISAAAFCDRVVAAAETAASVAQMAAATSEMGIANGESGTTAVRSMVAALALTEDAHAQLLEVTTQIS